MTSFDFHTNIVSEIFEEYACLETNMDRRDIPCSAYGNIKSRVIDKWKKNYPEISFDYLYLYQAGL